MRTNAFKTVCRRGTRPLAQAAAHRRIMVAVHHTFSRRRLRRRPTLVDLTTATRTSSSTITTASCSHHHHHRRHRSTCHSIRITEATRSRMVRPTTSRVLTLTVHTSISSTHRSRRRRMQVAAATLGHLAPSLLSTTMVLAAASVAATVAAAATAATMALTAKCTRKPRRHRIIRVRRLALT